MSDVERLTQELELAKLCEKLEVARTTMHADRSESNIAVYRKWCDKVAAARSAHRLTFPRNPAPGEGLAQPPTHHVKLKAVQP